MQDNSSYMLGRFVMVEKSNNSFLIRIEPIDLIDENSVWYYSHKSEYFRVRNASFYEIQLAEYERGFYPEYKEKLLRKGFYVVINELFEKGCWIGKCDAKIVNFF